MCVAIVHLCIGLAGLTDAMCDVYVPTKMQVGADGIWSVVRGQMHKEAPGKESATYSGYTCFTGVCMARPHDVKEVAYKVRTGRTRLTWIVCGLCCSIDRLTD